MKVYLYINKQGFKENTFRVAFKELVNVVALEEKSVKTYLIGKYEVRDYENSYDVPYNKKYEGRYFAIPISNREEGFFNLTTILCNNDLSDYPVINEVSLNATVKTLLKDANQNLSDIISLEDKTSRSRETQGIIQDVAASKFVSIINMLNTWAKEENQNIAFKLQIEF